MSLNDESTVLVSTASTKENVNILPGAPRFCVIDTDCSPAWKPITFSDMFRGCLEKPGDVWTTCHIAIGEPIPEDIFTAYQGVVLTGSRFNCRDREKLPWFEPLSNFIREAAERGSPRVYGGCFGCQLIAHALGGEVDHNPNQRFILKAEDIKWCACDCECNHECEGTSEQNCPCCATFPLSTDILQKLKSTGLHIIVSHGDCVRKVPESATLIASSVSCASEMFIAGRCKNIFASQSHPELDYQYAVVDRIWPVVVEQRKRLNEEELEIATSSFSRYTGEDARLFMSAISDFLHLPNHPC